MTDVIQRIRWLLDVSDPKGATRELLKQDREIRRGLERTDRQYRETQRTAASSAAAQATAAGKVSAAVQREGHAADQTAEDFRELSRAQQQALAAGSRIVAQSSQIEQAHRRRAAAAREATVAERAAARARSGIGSAAGAGAGVGRGALGTGIGALGLAGGYGLGSAVSEFEEARKTQGQLEAVIRSTGGAANATARDVVNLSDRLARVAAVDNDLVKQGAAVLLTFKQVRNEAGAGNNIFDRGTRAALNLSAALGKDMQGSVLQVGKALNDPIKGVTALGRAGVQFTAQQKDQIKTLVESGRTLDAQKVILRELESQFGGAARGRATPLDRLRVSADDLAESLGEALSPATDAAARDLGRFFDQLRDGTGAGGDVRRFGEDLWSGLSGDADGALNSAEQLGDSLRTAATAAADVAREIGPVARDVAEFASSHPEVAKVAGGLVAVGVAAKAIRFAGAVTGVNTLLRALGRMTGARAILTRTLDGAGTAAGNTASASIGEALTRRFGRSMSSRASAIRGALSATFGSAGNSAGRAAAARIAEGTADQIPASFRARRGRLNSAGRIMGGILAAGARAAFIATIPLWVPEVEDAILKALGKDKPSHPRSQRGGPFDLGASIPEQIGWLKDRLGGRRGGLATTAGVRRFQAGGLVPALVSPGEMFVGPDGSTAIVPGARVAADSVLAAVRPGTAVLTDDGQARWAAGASLREVIATQAPHFQAGGVVGPARIAALGRSAGFKGSALSTATAVALAESGGKIDAVGPPTPYGRAQGLWQIMMPVHQRLIERLGGDVLNPTTNARAAYRISSGGTNWRPWEAFTNGAYRRFLDQARGAAVRTRAGEDGADLGDSTATVPIRLGRSRRRAGLVEDALAQGIAAGESGLTRREIRLGLAGVRGARTNPIMDAIAGAQTPTRREVTLPGVDSAAGAAGGGAGGGSAGSWSANRTLAWANAFARRWKLKISSSWRSAARNRAAGGVPNSLHMGGSAANPHAFDFMPPRPEALAAARSLTPKPAEAMIHDAGSGLHLHVGLLRGAARAIQRRASGAPAPGGFRRIERRLGGFIPRFRTGGLAGQVETPGAGRALTRATNRVTTFAGGSMDELDAEIGRATEAKLDALRRALVTRVRLGGDKKIVQRLQGVIDLLDFEVGRRIGRINDVIARRTARHERSQSALDRKMRRDGIDPSSAAGLRRQSAFDFETIKVAQENLGSAESVFRRAKKTGNRDAIRAAQEQLNAARDALDEAFTVQIERRRQLAAKFAAERVDDAQFNVDYRTGDLAIFDAFQRFNGTADTAQGLRDRAGQLSASTGPLAELRDSLIAQAQTAAATGDVEGFRQALRGAQSATADLVNAQAEAAQAMREAAIRQAQDAVDASAFVSDITEARQSGFELSQRLEGTFDTAGGRIARADFIRTQVVPGLQAELADLENAARVAREQEGEGSERYRQAVLATLAKSNEIAQAGVDQQELIAENTEDVANRLKEFGGPRTFEFGGQRRTDLTSRVKAGA